MIQFTQEQLDGPINDQLLDSFLKENGMRGPMHYKDNPHGKSTYYSWPNSYIKKYFNDVREPYISLESSGNIILVHFPNNTKSSLDHISRKMPFGDFISYFYEMLPPSFPKAVDFTSKNIIPNILSNEDLRDIRSVVSSVFENSLQVINPNIKIQDTEVKIYPYIYGDRYVDDGEYRSFDYIYPLNNRWGIILRIMSTDSLRTRANARVQDFVKDDWVRSKYLEEDLNILNQSDVGKITVFFESYLSSLDLSKYEPKVWKSEKYKEIIID